MSTAQGSAPKHRPVTVRSVEPAAENHSRVRLDVSGTDLADRHTTPGQFVEVRPDGDAKGYFALANAPGIEPGAGLELLVKHGAGVADAIVATPPGGTLAITEPMGRGFMVDGFPEHDALLFAGGSGISAIRSVVRHLLRGRDQWGRIVLFYGVRSPEVMAYRDEIEDWKAGGVEVEIVCSQPGPAWTGHQGYVQARLETLAPEVNRAFACLCGVPGMHEAVSAWLQTAGLPKDRLLTNY
jgi:NAD(P)H-flavin reductase